MFTTIQELLAHKHRTYSIISVEAETTVDRVLSLMIQADVHHVPVLDEQRRLLGIIAQQDVRLAAESPFNYPSRVDLLDNMMSKLSAIRAGDIMVKTVTTVSQSDQIVDAAKLMRLGHIGALPVLGIDNRVVGIVTRTDLLDHLIRVLEPLSAERLASPTSMSKQVGFDAEATTQAERPASLG